MPSQTAITSHTAINGHAPTTGIPAVNRAKSRDGSRPRVVVIGAGPYGLSVAAHLRALGVHARVFGDPMATWRQNMPEGMFLKSTPRASSISAPQPGFSLLDFCDYAGVPRLTEEQAVPIDLFERYGWWFQERWVPWVEPVRAREVAPDGGGFRVGLESGEDVAADCVVVATGLTSFTYTPPELAGARLAGGTPGGSGLLTHSSEHRDLSRFADRRVAVIGAGQSALETAAILRERGAKVVVLARGRRVLFASPPARPGPGGPAHHVLKPPSPMGPGWSLYALHRGPALFRHLPLHVRLRTVHSVLGPSGAWWLRDRVDGMIDIRTEQWVRAATVEGEEVVLHLNEANRRSYELRVDHVIAATGYRVDVAAFEFLAPALRLSLERAGGSPRLTASFESSAPGLFFVGLPSAATFGPLLRFVCGTQFAASRVSAAITHQLRSHLS